MDVHSPHSLIGIPLFGKMGGAATDGEARQRANNYTHTKETSVGLGSWEICSGALSAMGLPIPP